MDEQLSGFETFLIATFCVLLACTPIKKVDWPDLITCVPPTADLLGLVGTALDHDDYVERLENLAAEQGTGAVVCAARKIYEDVTTESSGTESRRVRHARDFIEHTETEFR